MTDKRRVTLAASLTAAAVLIGGGVALAVWAPWQQTEPVVADAPTPTPTPTPEPVAVPVTTVARGALPGWELAGPAALAAVLPELGAPASGTAALRIDAPVVDAETVAARTTIAVEGERQYTVSIAYRQLAGFPVPVPAVLRVGDETVPLADADALWATATQTITAPPGVTELDVSIAIMGPVSGLSFDDVSVTSDEGVELIPNGSFEQVEASYGVINDSLVMTSRSAMLAVAMPDGPATWTAQPTAGGDPIDGATEIAGGLGGIPLTGLSQGHYEIHVADAAGGSVSTALAFIDVDASAITQDPRFGVGLHVENEWYRDAGAYAAALGYGEARNDILWRRNETQPGVYSWYEPYTREFDILHANGVKLLGIVNYNNKLYGKEKSPANEEAIAAYARYALAIADRFDLVGLEVFNEFNHDRFNDTPCGTSGACYLPMLQAVHDTVSPTHPDLPIVAGAAALYDRDFFFEMWQAGAMQFSDVMSYHPYEVSLSSPDDLRGVVQQSRVDMDEFAGGQVPVWITELGWSTKSGGTDLAGQGEMLARAEISALAAGAEKFFWYDLVNDSADVAVHEGNFGLYEFQPRPGTAALAPKPAAFVQALLIAELGGRDHAESAGDPDAYVEVFGTAQDAVRVAWAVQGEAEITLEADESLLVTDIFGRQSEVAPIRGKATIDLTSTPVFIRSASVK
ncbi:hypothetical protein F6J84_02150 [Microbacterium caowuchunii]|uniref:hypothetical protein n=1 Tax=Microbacterium caowuchunii TaxID=2614638 RepID=UPI001246F244|nr:hypothetical protein [Microbacterium caowuchunii]QEV99033.1 hypothetical protein F6J84_02150 [Microbacterium caowuchunii]